MATNKREKDKLTLSKEQKELAAKKVREYVEQNFDTEIGGLEARVFLDFICENISSYFYNKAIADASSFMSERAEDLYLLSKDEP